MPQQFQLMRQWMLELYFCMMLAQYGACSLYKTGSERCGLDCAAAATSRMAHSSHQWPPTDLSVPILPTTTPADRDRLVARAAAIALAIALDRRHPVIIDDGARGHQR